MKSLQQHVNLYDQDLPNMSAMVLYDNNNNNDWAEMKEEWDRS